MPSVHSLDQERCRQLEEFMPIQWSGLKFLSGLFNVLILEAVVGLGMYLVLKADAYLSDGARISIATFVGGGLLMAIPIYFITGKRGDWLRFYFNRNVRGYVARFWVHETDKSQKWFCHVDFGDGNPQGLWPASLLGGLMVEIRLGGWSSTISSGILHSNKQELGKLRHWRVRLHKIHFYTGAVLMTVEYTHPDADGKREQIVLEVSEAIRFLNFFQLPGNGVSISDVLHDFMRSKDKLATEVEKAREALRQSTGREAMFVDQLESLTRRIEQTDRLRTMIEGLGIYIQVLDALRLAFHATDPAKYDQVSDKLDQAKRDLERLKSRCRHRRLRDIPLVAR